MPLAVDRKKSLIEQFRTHEGDTGSPEVQIALDVAAARQSE